MIAIAWETFLLYRGYKHAPKLFGVPALSVESLDKTYKRVKTWSECEKREKSHYNVDGPGRNALASVIAIAHPEFLAVGKLLKT